MQRHYSTNTKRLSPLNFFKPDSYTRLTKSDYTFIVQNLKYRFYDFLQVALVLILSGVLLSGSIVPTDDQYEQIRTYTRQIEFNYAEWTLSALKVKLFQQAVGTKEYIPKEDFKQIMLDYLDLIYQIKITEAQIQLIYSDPNVTDPKSESAELRAQLQDMYAQEQQFGPVAEEILQAQISYVIGKMGIGLGGQPIPPLLYHSTPLPYALIVSPRDEIKLTADISLIPDLTLDQQVELEEQIDSNLNVSSLVVPIGGIGIYPTMVQQTSNINWLTEVVSHEWTHNFLSLRPLGVNYFKSPTLRVMNETTANISGKEISLEVLKTFYPEFVPPPSKDTQPQENPAPQPEPPSFDFRAEMHKTRVRVDELLAEGKVEEAEDYMEQQRKMFWEHGYQIRKLNQAYFAFYGAYADQPGGAAGAIEDPVGDAVRKLREQSPSLASFLNHMSWMSSFEQLQKAVNPSS